MTHENFGSGENASGMAIDAMAVRKIRILFDFM
jgi:hypothetical protein